MTEPKKTRKPATKAAAKKTTTTRKPRQPKATSKWIRNLRGMAVHFRLEVVTSDKELRIQLAPRGRRGDWREIPLAYTEDERYGRNLGIVFEEISRTEAEGIEYDQALGYQGGYQENVRVIRDVDTVVASGKDDPTGKNRVIVRPVGPKYVHAPGADGTQVEQMNSVQQGEGRTIPYSHQHGQTRFHEVAKEAETGEAMPPEGSGYANPTKVVVVRDKR